MKQAMKWIQWSSLMILLTTAAHSALPGDSAAGKRVYDANCTRCHDTSVHTRKDRHVQSLEALEQQVQACTQTAQKPLPATAVPDLVKYLNDEFYHFQN
jgi:hypothetical protein